MTEQTPEITTPVQVGPTLPDPILGVPAAPAPEAAAPVAAEAPAAQPEAGEETSLLTCDWDGEHYELDVMSVNAAEFRVIKQRLGLTAGRFLNAMSNIDDMDGDVAVALLWLFKLRAGVHAAMDDEDLQVLKFMTSIQFVKTPAPALGDEGPKA